MHETPDGAAINLEALSEDAVLHNRKIVTVSLRQILFSKKNARDSHQTNYSSRA